MDDDIDVVGRAHHVQALGQGVCLHQERASTSCAGGAVDVQAPPTLGQGEHQPPNGTGTSRTRRPSVSLWSATPLLKNPSSHLHACGTLPRIQRAGKVNRDQQRRPFGDPGRRSQADSTACRSGGVPACCPTVRSRRFATSLSDSGHFVDPRVTGMVCRLALVVPIGTVTSRMPSWYRASSCSSFEPGGSDTRRRKEP